MFYSVPTPTSISGQCLKSTLSNGYKNGVLSINGTGKVTLTPTCTISLPDGSTHTTPSRPLNQSQLLTDVFTNLQNLPQRTDFLIQDNTQLLFQPQPPITMAPTEEPTFNENFVKNFEPHNSLSTVAIVIILFCHLRMFIHVNLLFLSKFLFIMSLHRKDQPNYSSDRFYSGSPTLLSQRHAPRWRRQCRRQLLVH